MRVLVVADIHGNRAAVESIREPFDVCLCLGDLVDYGPEPCACVEWARRHATHCVRGNHDHGVAQDVATPSPAGTGFRFLTAVTRPRSVAALTPDQRRYLAELPTSRMLAIGGKKFLLVHATPRDPMDEYAPPDKAFWAPRLAGLHVDYVLAGHTHQPYTLRVNGTTVVNPGSVGLSRDGDPRAAYAVIETGNDDAIDTGASGVELKRIGYPVEETVEAARAVTADPLALQMLTDIYRGGMYLAKWASAHGTGRNGNGHANGAGKSDGTRPMPALPGQ